ncbi:MAG TPA: adenylosuccinate synthetase [Candidatus Nanoarchaeia archaeon]|nr:adenylosuccinate synthetase [Candidatus Nanoarchaeia archaeon]
MVKRKSVAIVGAQWGDEGKGKIVDYLCTEASKLSRASLSPSSLGKPVLVRRYQGGGNAGHTVIVGDQKYQLHLVPSGILISEAYNLLGCQVFVNPRLLMTEIKGLQQRGVRISSDNFGIAANAHVTLDYHVAEDQEAFKQARHTSTGNGIKQTAVDKQARQGIRFVEFLDRTTLKEVLIARAGYLPLKTATAEKMIASYAEAIDFLSQFLTQEHDVMRKHDANFEIWEGAQGIMLDVDVGEYPGTTSSNPAFIPGKTDLRLGVFKLYTSSAGTGDRPFVSQMDQTLEQAVRTPWDEFGTTTGKPRDIGWFDCVAARYAVEAANLDYAIGTCGDKLSILAEMRQPLKLVVGYKVGSQEYSSWDTSFHKRGQLKNAEPVVEEFKPWEGFADDNGKLTAEAQAYTERIEQLLGIDFIMYGTGPKQDDIMVLREPWDL